MNSVMKKEKQRGSDTKKVLTPPKFFYFLENNITKAGAVPSCRLSVSR